MNRSIRVVVLVSVVLAVAGRTEAADTKKMGGPPFVTPPTPGGAACGQGTYLAGIDFFAQPAVQSLGTFCASMEPDGGWNGVPAKGPQTMGSGGGGARQTLQCPRDSWVHGYKGYTQTYGGHAVTQLTLFCRNVKTGAVTPVASPFDSGLPQFEWPESDCDASSVATGVFGSTNEFVILELGFHCGVTQPALRQQHDFRAAGKPGVEVIPTPKRNPLERSEVSEPRPVAPLLKPASQTFSPPLNKDGTRVHACQSVGGIPCGQAPADAFCKAQGFGRAQSFLSAMERVHAETLSGQKCAALECNVFTRIECVK